MIPVIYSMECQVYYISWAVFLALILCFLNLHVCYFLGNINQVMFYFKLLVCIAAVGTDSHFTMALHDCGDLWAPVWEEQQKLHELITSYSSKIVYLSEPVLPLANWHLTLVHVTLQCSWALVNCSVYNRYMRFVYLNWSNVRQHCTSLSSVYIFFLLVLMDVKSIQTS